MPPKAKKQKVEVKGKPAENGLDSEASEASQSQQEEPTQNEAEETGAGSSNTNQEEEKVVRKPAKKNSKRGRPPKKEGAVSMEPPVKKTYRDYQLVSEIGDRVLVCGDGEVGHMLGHGAAGKKKDKKPRKIEIFDGKTIRQIAAGGMHSVVLLENGEVYTCGSNDENQMALGRPEVVGGGDDEYSYGKVVFPSEDYGKIVSIVVGAAYTAGLTDQGTVWVWGSFLDKDGKGSICVAENKDVMKMAATPAVLYRGPTESSKHTPRVIKISGGQNHVCMLMDDGQLFTVGVPETGALGRGRGTTSRGGRCVAPYQVSSRELFDDVWAFGYGNFAVARPKKPGDAPRLLAWGMNNHGQLGILDKTHVPFPTPSVLVESAVGEKAEWKQFVGEQHLLALTKEGKVYGCGLAQNSLLGDRTQDEISEPVQIDVSGTVVGITASEGGSFAWNDKGAGYSWGANNGGELGLGLDDMDEEGTPSEIKSKHIHDPDQDEHYKIIQISANSQHTMFLAKSVNE